MISARFTGDWAANYPNSAHSLNEKVDWHNGSVGSQLLFPPVFSHWRLHPGHFSGQNAHRYVDV
jgi:hypothetical protein